VQSRDIAIELVSEANSGLAVPFVTDWVSDSPAEARRFLASHQEPDGASLIAVLRGRAVGVVSILRESNYAGNAARGIPLVHQLIVGGPHRRHGVATMLMDAVEHLSRGCGVTELGVTVGRHDEYGPAQRLCARRGYVPDGRGACQGQLPLRKGTRLTTDDELTMWLTKDLAG
jgi:GNAT superfamily N-acetyltransferase